MIGSKKSLTPLGKFLATKAIELDLSRSELAARIGVSENLLHRLMHGRGYKLQSVNRVLSVFAEDITEDMADTFKLGAKDQMTRFVFYAVPGSTEEIYLKAIEDMLPIIPELGAHFFDAAKAHMLETTDLEAGEEEEPGEQAWQGQQDPLLAVEVTAEEAEHIESGLPSIPDGHVEAVTIPADELTPPDDDTAL